METTSVVFEHEFDESMLAQIDTLRTVRLNMAETMLHNLHATAPEPMEPGPAQRVEHITPEFPAQQRHAQSQQPERDCPRPDPDRDGFDRQHRAEPGLDQQRPDLNRQAAGHHPPERALSPGRQPAKGQHQDAAQIGRAGDQRARPEPLIFLAKRQEEKRNRAKVDRRQKSGALAVVGGAPGGQPAGDGALGEEGTAAHRGRGARRGPGPADALDRRSAPPPAEPGPAGAAAPAAATPRARPPPPPPARRPRSPGGSGRHPGRSCPGRVVPPTR